MFLNFLRALFQLQVLSLASLLDMTLVLKLTWFTLLCTFCHCPCEVIIITVSKVALISSAFLPEVFLSMNGHLTT